MRKQAANSMVAILAVMAIILVATVYFMFGGFGPKPEGSSRADGKGITTLGAARYKAKDTVCQERLNQVRQGIMVFETSNDGYPEELQDIRIGGLLYACPIGKEPYVYDSRTGQVHCAYPGHEKF